MPVTALPTKAYWQFCTQGSEPIPNFKSAIKICIYFVFAALKYKKTKIVEYLQDTIRLLKQKD